MRSHFLPSDPKSLRRELEHFGRDIFPDGLYVILASELPVRCHPSLGGCASVSLSRWHRRELEGQGRWRGVGPAILLNDQTIWEQRFNWYDCFLPDVAAFAAHEMAHLFDMGTLAFESDDANTKSRFEAEYRDRLTKEIDPCVSLLSPDFNQPPWALHGSAFIRAALHIGFRLVADGWPVACEQLFYGHVYGLSTAWDYQDAIGDEPQSLAGLSIPTILTLPPPAAFAELWAADTKQTIVQPECLVAACSSGK